MATLKLKALQETLAQSGLLLCDALLLAELPDNIWLSEPKQQKGALLFIGHAGTRFWQAYRQQQTTYQHLSHPVDEFSREISEKALIKHMSNTDYHCWFPVNHCPVNLINLGRYLGWHSPSPIGLGIHPEYGLWSAYRSLWWLDASEIDKQGCTKTLPTDVCSQCETQDCVKACPAEAVTHQQMPDMFRCASHRFQANSSCQNTCLARCACPVATEYRYSDEQINYHYDLARSQLKHYLHELSRSS